MGQNWRTNPESIPDEQIAETKTADIVIVGAGHAGNCAARAAAEAGASVIVLEQQKKEKQFILGIGEIGHINSQSEHQHCADAGAGSRKIHCFAGRRISECLIKII